MKIFNWLSFFFLALLVHNVPVLSHPHVFVDGGVDFVFEEEYLLSALLITWVYYEFEFLYILSSNGMSVNSQGIS